MLKADVQWSSFLFHINQQREYCNAMKVDSFKVQGSWFWVWFFCCSCPNLICPSILYDWPINDFLIYFRTFTLLIIDIFYYFTFQEWTYVVSAFAKIQYFFWCKQAVSFWCTCENISTNIFLIVVSGIATSIKTYFGANCHSCILSSTFTSVNIYASLLPHHFICWAALWLKLKQFWGICRWDAWPAAQ